MFRWFRWHLAKRRLTARPTKSPPAHVTISAELHTANVEDFVPNEGEYRRLASLWEDYAGWFVPAYGPFLTSARDYYRCPIRSVLDLACGTGLLSRQVACWAESVVGLDVSEDMLQEASLRTSEKNIRYAQGDFRDFHVEGTFDAVLCGSDSLNYVNTPAELTDVFRCVGRHLRPGGLFAFDVLDRSFFREIAGKKIVAKVGEEQFELYAFYDPVKKVNEARVVFCGAVERHRRIPIIEEDVVRAAREAKLECLEHFSRETYNLSSCMGERQFYLLRVPRT